MEKITEASANRVRQLAAWIDTHHSGVQADFVRKYELNQGEISQFLLSKRTLGERRARRLETQVGMPKMYLDSSVSHEMSAPEPVRSLSDNDAVPSGYHAIPEYEVRLSCGTGNTIDYAETETKSRIYHESFFANNHAKPENVVRLGAEGNSMKPVIKHGYRVAVHTAAKEIPVVSAHDAQDEDNLKIFFLLDDGARKCKYVYIDESTNELVLHSQNTAFKDERYSQEYATDYIVIVGEVIDISGNPNK